MPQIPNPRARSRPRLEIIPFIDIMFFLLATFMMVSLQMIRNEGINVKFPTAEASEKVEPVEAEQKLTLSVNQAGAIFVNRDPVANSEELTERLARFRAEQPEGVIILMGDERADFGRVVKVIDAARGAGLNRFAIRTKASATPPSAAGPNDIVKETEPQPET